MRTPLSLSNPLPCGLLLAFLWAGIFCCPTHPLIAQTLLQPGDLAIIRVNANNRDCSGTNSADDLVSFVCFQDILPNTVLQITDNGWERRLPGRWGNSEGFVAATRTGPAIPAGTVITFLLPPIGNAAYRAIAPDAGWSFVEESFNSLNLNSGGEQFYFMQGGIWDNSNTGVNFDHDATYTGGRLLFGFNTKTSWNAFTDNSQDSGLHPNIASCYHMEPTGNATDYISYTGPQSPATQLEWISRIGNPANWTTFPNCTSMPAPPARLDLLPSGIALQCSICSSCSPFQETLRFLLPATGGPFKVSYSDGRDTFLLNRVMPGDSVRYQTIATTNIQFLSITDVNGCPVFSNIGDPLTLRVTPADSLSLVPPILACTSGSGEGTFDLRSRDSLIAGGIANRQVRWFRDSLLQNPIANPAQFVSSGARVYAQVIDGACTAGPLGVDLIAAQSPTVELPLGGKLCAGEPCLPMAFSLTGKAPFLLAYSLGVGGNTSIPGQTTLDSSQAIWNICPAQFGLAKGDLVFTYHTLTDANGCSTPLNNQRSVVRTGIPGINEIKPVLCAGETYQVREKTYDASNPRDTIRLLNAAQSGCDSLIIVSLTYSEPISAELTGDTLICPGEPLSLVWRLTGGARFRIVYMDGALNKELTGVQNGDPLNLKPTGNTQITLLSIISEESGCEIRPFRKFNIRINDLSVFPQAVPRFGGNAVSCSGAKDGEAQLLIRGGIKPYRISWSTGDTTDLVRNLAAGTYPVTVIDAERCRIESAVRLSEPAPIQPSLETASAKCQGEESKLLVKNITGGTQPYLFSTDGQTFQTVRNLPFTLKGLAPGTYRFSLKDANNCVSETPFTLTEPSLSLVDLGPDRVIQSGDSVQLTATANFAPKRITWNPAEVTPSVGDPLLAVVRPLRTTSYRIELADTSGCIVSDVLTVIVENQQRVFAPSAFSPNEDGQNDRFVLFSGPEVREIINLQIFNRWGALVYEAPIVQGTDGWDGTFKGQAAPTGIYLFVAEIRLTSGETQRISGDFLLMR